MPLLFSQFKAQEFEQLCQVLCRVFDTTPVELAKLYQKIDKNFDLPRWPLCYVSRDFFKSVDEEFRLIYQKSPVVAVDLPSLMEWKDGKNDKPTIAIVGQDSKHERSWSLQKPCRSK